jgi:hypothetical protein
VKNKTHFRIIKDNGVRTLNGVPIFFSRSHLCVPNLYYRKQTVTWESKKMRKTPGRPKSR